MQGQVETNGLLMWRHLLLLTSLVMSLKLCLRYSGVALHQASQCQES